MFVQSPPYWVSHLGGQELLTMQGGRYHRFLIHRNLQQLCAGRIPVIWVSLAVYITRKLEMPSVTFAWVSTSCPRLCSKDWISRSYPNLEDSSTCWCLNQVSVGGCGESTSIRPRLLHLCVFRGPWYARWCGNSTHSWEVIPKWRSSKDQCGKWDHPFPHWEEELDVYALKIKDWPTCEEGFSRTWLQRLGQSSYASTCSRTSKI
jgi:hypothetical protein